LLLVCVNITNGPLLKQMKPKLTCPHCDKEISVSANQITVRQNWKYVILLVVLPLLFFIPTYKVVYFKPVITEDLSLMDVSTSLNGLTLELRGVVENKSENAWNAVMVEAEFFDQDGNFVDEAKASLTTSIKEHSREHFKVRLNGLGKKALKLEPRVKLTGGYAE
jgi:hypothetical protein